MNDLYENNISKSCIIVSESIRKTQLSMVGQTDNSMKEFNNINGHIFKSCTFIHI